MDAAAVQAFTASNCCFRERQGTPEVVCFIFLRKVVCCVFFASSSVTIARFHHAASDVLLVTCEWCYCCRFWALHGVSGVPIGALLVVLQQWLVVVARFWLADVGQGVDCSSTWSVLRSVVLGRGILLWLVGTLGRRQVVSSRHSAAGGRRVMSARLMFWGREPVAWAQMQLIRNRHFCFQNKRALL